MKHSCNIDHLSFLFLSLLLMSVSYYISQKNCTHSNSSVFQFFIPHSYSRISCFNYFIAYTRSDDEGTYDIKCCKDNPLFFICGILHIFIKISL